MNDTKSVSCEHCTKEDCKSCVSKDGKNFCCENCFKDYEERKETPKEESVNVCKFC